MADKLLSGLPALIGALKPAAIFGATQDGTSQGVTAEQILDFLANNAAGINFPVGTFIPAILGTTSNPSVTYGVRVGRYTRLGNIVQIEMRLDWTALTGGSGSVRIDMPGAPNALAEEFSGMLAAAWHGITLPAGLTSVTGRLRTGEGRVDIMSSGSNQSSATSLALSSLANAGRITLAGTYISN